jgi:hypothetical protein
MCLASGRAAGEHGSPLENVLDDGIATGAVLGLQRDPVAHGDG